MDGESGNTAHPSDLWDPFLQTLPISGASVTVMTEAGSGTSLGSSDAIAARIDEVQFELGEGPRWTAFRSGLIVSIPDVARGDYGDWPVFGAELRTLPVGAVFAIPMKMGAAIVGVAGLYRDRAGDLTIAQLRSALAIASAISSPAVQRAIQSAEEISDPESAMTPALRREVHQATGMILAQLQTTATIAYSRLQAYAFANGRTVHDVAHDVVSRVISFEDMN